MNIDNYIKDKYLDVPDLVIRKLKYNNSFLYLYYLESISNSDKICDYILMKVNMCDGNLEDIVSSPKFIKLEKKDVCFYLDNAFVIVVYKNNIYATEVKGNLIQSISSPVMEQDLYGAKDSFTESYEVNIGLIKRRIKSSELKTIERYVGRYTKNKCGILFVDNIVNKNLVDKCLKIVDKIDIDGITDIGVLKQYFSNNKYSFFPSVKLTERPDVVSSALLNGKIIIVLDNSPFVMIIPAVLADFINPISDMYVSPSNANVLKILRLICFFLTIFVPGFYIAIVNYNQEAIPSKLLTSFIIQKQGVPFPSSIEMFFMLFICEMLRESDLRFPNNYSAAISILGALILGDAAVTANIVSPITIIIVSLTFISSMIFSNLEITSAIRYWRFLTLLEASFLGLYGVSLAFISLIINLCAYNSFNLDYTFPVSPFDLSYIKDTLVRVKNNYFRSKYLTKNIRKEKSK